MKKTGFTLVELLVVIAIIALLMSILMPALARTRRQAKAIVCMANLRQWALIWQMYTSDHEGYFNPGDGIEYSFEWMEAIQPYTKEKDLYCCPIAVKRNELWEGVMGTTTSTWEWTYPSGEYFFGSYGINEFCFDPAASLKVIWGHPVTLNWRHINYRNTGDIPMLVDCAWAGGAPDHSDEPPIAQGEPYEGNYVDNMKRFCLDRHDGHVNGAFLDFSARKIGLKELWKLKWHRRYDTNADPPIWPEWMRKFKDYE